MRGGFSLETATVGCPVRSLLAGPAVDWIHDRMAASVGERSVTHMRKIQLSLFADYFQFYIQDDDEAVGDLSDAWTKEATDRLMAVSDRVIGVGTVRNVDVPVCVNIVDKLPELRAEDWDRINRTSIECRTGRFVIAGCTDYFPDAERIDVNTGTYDVIVGYKDLESLSDDGLDGDDSYHLFLALS